MLYKALCFTERYFGPLSKLTEGIIFPYNDYSIKTKSECLAFMRIFLSQN